MILLTEAAKIVEHQLQNVLTDPLVSFSTLFASFLKGKGILYMQCFVDDQNHFNDIINLDSVKENGFHAKMFCWAVTGSYALEPDAAPIAVCFLLFNGAWFI